MLEAQCCTCGKSIQLGTTVTECGPHCNAKTKGKVLIFGEGYSEYIVGVHRDNISSPEKRTAREHWERRFVNWCLETAEPYVRSTTNSYRVLSLGCGLGLDVAELVARGHDAYGMETADISEIWEQVLGDNASRCVVSTSGTIPFAERTFDLIVSMNVLEHVGTIPPKEIVTPETDAIRQSFVRHAVTHLRPGGVFLLVAPSRNHPIDRGHSHYYMPLTYWMMAKYGFSWTNPLSRRNFLPSPGDVSRWCRQISRDIPLRLDFRMDRSLFGLPLCPPDMIGRMLHIAKQKLPNFLLPHFHAIIQRQV